MSLKKALFLICLPILLISCDTASKLTSTTPKISLPFFVTAAPMQSATSLPDPSPERSTLFPKTMSLKFKPLELLDLKEGKVKAAWEKLNTIPFGSLHGQPVTLTLYRVPVEEGSLLSAPINALLQFQGKSYLILDVSASLLQPQGEFNQSLYILQHNFPLDKNEQTLLGGFELFANGSGRNIFLIYNTELDSWTTFEEWGVPSFSDLDKDGVEDFIIEFQGLHMQWPDLTIINWTTEGELQTSGSIKELLALDGWFEVSLNKNSIPPIISFSDVKDVNSPIVEYLYGNKQLIKK